MNIKKQVIVFIFSVLTLISIAPAVNIFIGTADIVAQKSNTKVKPWWHSSIIYNLDFGTVWLSRILSPLGISIAPDQVVIGFNKWLFLGNRYVNIRDAVRQGQTSKDITTAVKIGKNTVAWANWFDEMGVQLYRVMVAPNKSTIYPEKLPNWAKPTQSHSSIDSLFTETNGYYIDLRKSLLDAKKSSSEDLYFHTDTHWNFYGAWIGFMDFISTVNETGQNLNYPKNSNFKFGTYIGGDLGRFLRIHDTLSDVWPTILDIDSKNIETNLYDYNSQKLIGTNLYIHPGLIQNPLHVISKKALNKKKVLWIRDSFGTAFSPFMAATFTDIIQVHNDSALDNNCALLIGLIKSYQPDYVFVTIVERDALSPLFLSPPPSGDID